MRRSLGALSDVTEEDDSARTLPPPPPAAVTSPQRNDRQSVASQFSDVSNCRIFLLMIMWRSSKRGARRRRLD